MPAVAISGPLGSSGATARNSDGSDGAATTRRRSRPRPPVPARSSRAERACRYRSRAFSVAVPAAERSSAGRSDGRAGDDAPVTAAGPVNLDAGDGPPAGAPGSGGAEPAEPSGATGPAGPAAARRAQRRCSAGGERSGRTVRRNGARDRVRRRAGIVTSRRRLVLVAACAAATTVLVTGPAEAATNCDAKTPRSLHFKRSAGKPPKGRLFWKRPNGSRLLRRALPGVSQREGDRPDRRAVRLRDREAGACLRVRRGASFRARSV